MYKLQRTFMRKFVETKDVKNYSVLGEHGFIKIKKAMKTIQYEVCSIVFEDYSVLLCADDHLLIDENDNEVYAKDSIGSKIKSKGAPLTVIDFIPLGINENMYDLELETDHKFYTDGVLSHNTTVVGGYLTHMVLFNDDYKIACLANKAAAAREVLARIKMIYEGLPWWLQQGVKTWNKGDIELGNGSIILTAATTGSGIRGKSVNCLGGDTPIIVRDKETLDIKTITMEELDKELEEYVRLQTNLTR